MQHKAHYECGPSEATTERDDTRYAEQESSCAAWSSYDKTKHAGRLWHTAQVHALRQPVEAMAPRTPIPLIQVDPALGGVNQTKTKLHNRCACLARDASLFACARLCHTAARRTHPCFHGGQGVVASCALTHCSIGRVAPRADAVPCLAPLPAGIQIFRPSPQSRKATSSALRPWTGRVRACAVRNTFLRRTNHRHAAAGGQIKDSDDASDIKHVDLSQVHYLSGPIRVEDSAGAPARPGDLLCVEICDLGPFPGDEWGFTGALGSDSVRQSNTRSATSQSDSSSLPCRHLRP